MADQKDVGAVSRVAVGRDLGWNKVVHKAIEGGEYFCEFDFHEIRAAFCINLDKSAVVSP
jgi:hypothetical protein